MPGYSGTPLAKKLGIKDDFRAALLHMPDDVRTELRDALGKCRIQHGSAHNQQRSRFYFLFAKSRAGLELELVPAAKALAPAGMLWISWPKKNFRRRHRSHGKCNSPERARCWPGRRKSLRGHRGLVGIEVRDPGQESAEEINVETAAPACPGEHSSPAVSVVYILVVYPSTAIIAGASPRWTAEGGCPYVWLLA